MASPNSLDELLNGSTFAPPQNPVFAELELKQKVQQQIQNDIRERDATVTQKPVVKVIEEPRKSKPIAEYRGLWLIAFIIVIGFLSK